MSDSSQLGVHSLEVIFLPFYEVFGDSLVETQCFDLLGLTVDLFAQILPQCKGLLRGMCAQVLRQFLEFSNVMPELVTTLLKHLLVIMEPGHSIIVRSLKLLQVSNFLVNRIVSFVQLFGNLLGPCVGFVDDVSQLDLGVEFTINSFDSSDDSCQLLLQINDTQGSFLMLSKKGSQKLSDPASDVVLNFEGEHFRHVPMP